MTARARWVWPCAQSEIQWRGAANCGRPAASARTVFEGLPYCSPKHLRAGGPIPIAPDRLRAEIECESCRRLPKLRPEGTAGHSEDPIPNASMPELEGIGGQVGSRVPGAGRLASTRQSGNDEPQQIGYERQECPRAETSRLVFRSLRFCISSTSCRSVLLMSTTKLPGGYASGFSPFRSLRKLLRPSASE
jgi:hypothetical protein